jgi:RNA polymerase sigma factor (sigma-70 family)
MHTNPRPTGSRSLVTLFDAGTLGARTDRELLECFQSDRGAAGQDAFRVLVERHGPMVLGTCHSLVRDPHEAEDAFQATFLILVSKAATIQRTDTIGPWLHGVAARVARRAFHRSELRRRREVHATDDIPGRECQRPSPQPFEHVVHEEIARLPESIRAPMVLCCLQGLSYDLAARQLGVNEPTLRGRLHRGRKRLASRLHARGIPTTLLGRQDRPLRVVVPPLPLPLVESTVQFSLRWPSVSGLLGQASVIPGSITTLAQGVVSSMLFHTVKLSCFVVLVSAGVLGTVVLAQQGRDGGGGFGGSSGNAGAAGAEQKPAAPAGAKAGSGGGDAAQEVITKPKADQEPRLVTGRLELVDRADKTRLIQEKLNQLIAARFPKGTTLSELLKHIKHETTDETFPGIPIYIDPAGLAEAHQSMEMPVVINTDLRPVAMILSDALGGSGLSYCVDDGFLKISSRALILERRVEQIERKLDRVLDALGRLEAAK